MKSQGAAKNEANNAAQSAPAKSVATFTATSDMAEKIDFSKVKIEPLFEEQVDFDTFSKSDFRAVKVKECVAVPKSKKLLQFTLDDGTDTDRTILSGIHSFYEPEELVGKTLIAITNLPPRAMTVSYTHLDVYKRQRVCRKKETKNRKCNTPKHTMSRNGRIFPQSSKYEYA